MTARPPATSTSNSAHHLRCQRYRLLYELSFQPSPHMQRRRHAILGPLPEWPITAGDPVKARRPFVRDVQTPTHSSNQVPYEVSKKQHRPHVGSPLATFMESMSDREMEDTRRRAEFEAFLDGSEPLYDSEGEEGKLKHFLWTFIAIKRRHGRTVRRIRKRLARKVKYLIHGEQSGSTEDLDSRTAFMLENQRWMEEHANDLTMIWLDEEGY